MRRDQRGQALPLLVLVIVVMGAGTVVIGRYGEAAVDRAGAQTAADAAALAGAVEGREGAARLAQANRGRLVGYSRTGEDTRVVVEVRRGRATAKARRVGGVAAGLGGAADARGLAPAMQAAISRAQQLLGTAVPITSGYRSTAQQAALYARRGSNRFPVAPPGRSMHERGLAIDVPSWFIPRLLSVASQSGLCQPLPRTDPVHFEVCGARR